MVKEQPDPKNETSAHEQWLQNLRNATREKAAELTKQDDTDVEGKVSGVWQQAVLPSLVFIAALLPRLYFLFFVSGVENAGPDWYGDVYHHWQIAYLSWTVGFHNGFLRLWDLKGMEYFWGLLHPLILSALFTITGSIDLLVPRLLSAASGAGIVWLLFLIIRRYFGTGTAILAAAWAAFFPVMVYSDGLGMQDQLALFILLGGIYFWPAKPALSGLLWGVAGMGRSEFWIYGLGLLIAAGLIDRKGERIILALVTWGFISLLYMKYLLDKTGNPIYPVWWNYLGNAAGRWEVEKPLTADAILAQWVFRGLFLMGVVGALLTFFKKPRGYLLYLLGSGVLIFNGIFFGFSAYIYGWLNRYYVDRLLDLSYIYLGFLLSVFFVYYLGQKVRLWGKLKLGALMVLILLAFAQVIFWPVIMGYFTAAQQGWPPQQALAADVAKFYDGGRILIPEDRAPFTYALVRFNGINGENIVGEMFDPYFYMEGDPYVHWNLNRVKVLSWLKNEDIRLMAFPAQSDRYRKLVAKEPQYFTLKENGEILDVYAVNMSSYNSPRI